MAARNGRHPEVWFSAGVRTPFAKVDGPLGTLDAIALSVPVVGHMLGGLANAHPDFCVWGTVVPNLTWSNIAREIWMDAGAPATIPAFSTVMACATSMIGIQLGLGQSLSDWIRRFQQARSLGQRVAHATDLKLGDIRLFIPSVTNRTSGMSMGEHTEITAKEWKIGRVEQDELALEGHQRATAAWDKGFFDDLVIPVGDLRRDTIPRKDSSLEKLARLPPVFDRTSGLGSLTAGNSSPLTDGAASLWVASSDGLAKLPANLPKAKLIDWEIASVDFHMDGLLMAPAFAIPRLLARNGLVYADIDLWEIHEAFAAQVLFHIKALETPEFLRNKVGVEPKFGAFPRERLNPNGGSVALGHPFGATGARIISQALKELSIRAPGSRAIVSICTDGGQVAVVLLEAAK